MALVKLALSIYIICLSFGCLCASVRFLADIKRFKDPEKRFQAFTEISKEIESKTQNESEVKKVEPDT